MKPAAKEKHFLCEAGIPWFKRPVFLIQLLALFIMASYFVLIRPFLVPAMATVAVELIAAGALIISLGLSLVIMVFSGLITLVAALRARSRSRIKPRLLRLRKQSMAALIFALYLFILTLCTQWTAYTPPILGSDGKPLPGSIASLEKVTLGGSRQWITLRGRDHRNPVLLFLAGGPGGSQLAATREQLKGLEDYFVVVNWDQPGSGKSYHSVPAESLNPDRYVSDAHELAMYLCERFDKKKIYVMGESWGSALGIWLVQKYPELFNAFIGTGQMVSFLQTEIYDYEKAMEIANERGDYKKLEELRLQGPPPYYGDDMVWKESAYLMYLSGYMAENTEIANPGYNTLNDMAGPEYGLYDKVNYLRGVAYTFNHVYQQLYDLDLRTQADVIEVPAYFLEGRHDVNAPTVLAEEYYNLLSAPHKELIWFEHSGHSPWINERGKFVDTVTGLLKK